jgi:hypothetical protein
MPEMKRSSLRRPDRAIVRLVLEGDLLGLTFRLEVAGKL